MIKYLLTCLIIGSMAIATPLSKMNDISADIFNQRRQFVDQDLPRAEVTKLQAQAQKGVNILNGEGGYGVSALRGAEYDDYMKVLGFLYQSSLVGQFFNPNKQKVYEAHEKVHLTVLGIMQQGIREILKDYTILANREVFLHRVRESSKNPYNVHSYGLDLEKYLSERALKIMFPEEFVSYLTRFGCNKNQQEAYELAMAVIGKSYTMDKAGKDCHFFYGRYNEPVTVTYQSVKKGAITITTKTVTGLNYKPKADPETFYYKEFEGNKLYDRTFLAAKQASEETFYRQARPIKVEEAIAILASTYQESLKVSFPHFSDGPNKTVIPYDLKAGDSSSRTMRGYLDILFKIGVNLKELQAAIDKLKINRPSGTLEQIKKFVEEALKKGMTTSTTYVSPEEEKENNLSKFQRVLNDYEDLAYKFAKDTQLEIETDLGYKIEKGYDNRLGTRYQTNPLIKLTDEEIESIEESFSSRADKMDEMVKLRWRKFKRKLATYAAQKGYHSDKIWKVLESKGVLVNLLRESDQKKLKILSDEISKRINDICGINDRENKEFLPSVNKSQAEYIYDIYKASNVLGIEDLSEYRQKAEEERRRRPAASGSSSWSNSSNYGHREPFGPGWRSSYYNGSQGNFSGFNNDLKLPSFNFQAANLRQECLNYNERMKESLSNFFRTLNLNINAINAFNRQLPKFNPQAFDNKSIYEAYWNYVNLLVDYIQKFNYSSFNF